MRDFMTDDAGAVTVDWVVLTAAMVGLGVAVTSSVLGGSQKLASGIADSLSAAEGTASSGSGSSGPGGSGDGSGGDNSGTNAGSGTGDGSGTGSNGKGSRNGKSKGNGGGRSR